MKPLEELLREWLQRRAKHYCDPSTGMSERNLGKAELCTEVINKIDALFAQAPADTPSLKETVETCAKWVEGYAGPDGCEYVQPVLDALEKREQMIQADAVAAERERCAKARELMQKSLEFLETNHPMKHDCVLVCNCKSKLIAEIRKWQVDIGEIQAIRATPASEPTGTMNCPRCGKNTPHNHNHECCWEGKGHRDCSGVKCCVCGKTAPVIKNGRGYSLYQAAPASEPQPEPPSKPKEQP